MQSLDDYSKYRFRICPCCSKPIRPKVGDTVHREADIVLDPMAGSGTALVGCSMGRHVICVEMESKFCEIMKGNWKKIQQRGPMMGCEMGTAQIICGDARNLEGLLAEKVEIVVTSPPYAEQPQSNRTEHGILAHPQDCNCNFCHKNKGNKGMGQGYRRPVDAILTSPPYEGSLEASSRHTRGGIPSRDKKLGQTGSYADFDEAEVMAKASSGFCSKEARAKIRGSARGYSASEGQIGNLKNDSYLQAMFLIYAQCFAVLKDGGLLILVIKNFIRNRVEIRLDLDTIKLAGKAGFTYVEQHHRILTQQSFWRTIYRRRYPSAPVIDKEYILVFAKVGASVV